MVVTLDDIDRILDDALARTPNSSHNASIEAVKEVGDHILDTMFQATSSTEIMAILHGANGILAKGRWFLFPEISMRHVNLLLQKSRSIDALEIVGTSAALMHQLAMLWDQLPNEDAKQINWSVDILKDISNSLTERLSEFQFQLRTQGNILISLGLLDILREAAPNLYTLAVGDTAAKRFVWEMNQALEHLRTATKVRNMAQGIDQIKDLPKN